MNCPQNLFLDGTLQPVGLDPLPSEKGPCARTPALQICGFKDGRATDPAEYHNGRRPTTLRTHSRWCASAGWLSNNTQEEATPSIVKKRRSDEPMERSPAVGGCAPDRIRNAGSSESEVHLLSVNGDSLGEGIIRDV